MLQQRLIVTCMGHASIIISEIVPLPFFFKNFRRLDASRLLFLVCGSIRSLVAGTFATSDACLAVPFSLDGGNCIVQGTIFDGEFLGKRTLVLSDTLAAPSDGEIERWHQDPEDLITHNHFRVNGASRGVPCAVE